jgi:hypothetical protein
MFTTRTLPQKPYHTHQKSQQHERHITDNLATVRLLIRALAELSSVSSTALPVVHVTPVPWQPPTTHEPQHTQQHLHHTEPLSVLTQPAGRHRHLPALSLSAVDGDAATAAIESQRR